MSRLKAAHEDALQKLRQEMATALKHAEEEADALRQQMEKRVSVCKPKEPSKQPCCTQKTPANIGAPQAANAQLAEALAQVAVRKDEVANLTQNLKDLQTRAEKREAEVLAIIAKHEASILALKGTLAERDARIGELEEKLRKAGTLERELRLELSNAESLIAQKTKTIGWYEAEVDDLGKQNMELKTNNLSLTATLDKERR